MVLLCLGCDKPEPRIVGSPTAGECCCPRCPLCGGPRYGCPCSADDYREAEMDMRPLWGAEWMAVAA